MPRETCCSGSWGRECSDRQDWAKRGARSRLLIVPAASRKMKNYIALTLMTISILFSCHAFSQTVQFDNSVFNRIGAIPAQAQQENDAHLQAQAQRAALQQQMQIEQQQQQQQMQQQQYELAQQRAQLQTDDQIRQQIIQASVAGYQASGHPCACPYNVTRRWWIAGKPSTSAVELLNGRYWPEKMKNYIFALFIILAILPANAFARGMGGHYAGGHGSSHKGGHYKNARTVNHYTHHKHGS
jgi:hypothetical protein